MSNKQKKSVNNSQDNTKKKKKKLYLSFNSRLILSILAFMLFLIFGLMFLLKSFSFVEQKIINYDEKSNLDYKVYLKENEFYEKDYLEKDKLYIASLIDKISIDFNYTFTSSENIDLDFNYDIIGRVVISDSEGKTPYYEKEYILLENKKVAMNNSNIQDIKESIDIDYEYYNNLANNFKMTFGVNTTSNLIVYLKINKTSNNENTVLNNTSTMLLTIPLSEKSINIKMDYKEIDNSSTLLKKSTININNVIYIIVAIIFIIISIVMLIKSMRLSNLVIGRKSIYDKYIDRLLTEYDRLIVESSTFPTFKNKEIIKIDKFKELLDVRDNLRRPITYYSVTKHQKSYFYIYYEDKIYLHTVKAVDLEEENKS